MNYYFVLICFAWIKTKFEIMMTLVQVERSKAMGSKIFPLELLTSYYLQKNTKKAKCSITRGRNVSIILA